MTSLHVQHLLSGRIDFDAVAGVVAGVVGADSWAAQSLRVLVVSQRPDQMLGLVRAVGHAEVDAHARR